MLAVVIVAMLYANPDLSSFVQDSISGLTPGRNLTSRWAGTDPQGVTYKQSNVCEYMDDLSLEFRQNDEQLTGTISFTSRKWRDLDIGDFIPCPPEGYLKGEYQIHGTVNGTDITFETQKLRGDPALPIVFTGKFTTDIISGTFDRKPYSSSQLAQLTSVSGTWSVTRIK